MFYCFFSRFVWKRLKRAWIQKDNVRKKCNPSCYLVIKIAFDLLLSVYFKLYVKATLIWKSMYIRLMIRHKNWNIFKLSTPKVYTAYLCCFSCMRLLIWTCYCSTTKLTIIYFKPAFHLYSIWIDNCMCIHFIFCQFHLKSIKKSFEYVHCACFIAGINKKNYW